MKKYKAKIIFKDGEIMEIDGVFDTEAEAEEYAIDSISEISQGYEILNMSNPGDYPLDEEVDDEVDGEVEVTEIIYNHPRHWGTGKAKT